MSDKLHDDTMLNDNNQETSDQIETIHSEQKVNDQTAKSITAKASDVANNIKKMITKRCSIIGHTCASLYKQQKLTTKMKKSCHKLKKKTVSAAHKTKVVIQSKKDESESLDKIKAKSKQAITKVSTTINEKKAEKQELKPEKVILAPGEIKKYKLFFVSDMEEEAAYLHEMSINGMHFIKKAGMQYVFKTGEAKNYYYHLGYYEKDKRNGERYSNIYEDAGWENIYHEKGEFNGMWNYFRTEVEEAAPAPEIFSDRVSRIALYERLLTSWKSLLLMIMCCLICMAVILFVLNTQSGRINPAILIFCIIFSIIFILIFAMYCSIYGKVKKKLTELNTK